MKWFRLGAGVMAVCIAVVLVHTIYSLTMKTGIFSMFSSQNATALNEGFGFYALAIGLLIPKTLLYLWSYYLGFKSNNPFLKNVSFVLLLIYILGFTPVSGFLLGLQVISTLLLAIGVIKIKAIPSAHTLGVILLILGITEIILASLGILAGLTAVGCAMSGGGCHPGIEPLVWTYFLVASLFPILPYGIMAKLFLDASAIYETPRSSSPD